MIQIETHGAVTAIRMARGLLGRPIYWTAAYYVDGLLIDSGPVCTAHELVRALDKLLVRQVVVTHCHEDHIGGLAAVRGRFPEARLYAARKTMPFIAEPRLLGMQFYRRAIWGVPKPVGGVLTLDLVDEELRTEEYTFRVIETPGHSEDHIALFEPQQRWLFTGDAFIGGQDVAWTPEFNLFGTVGSLRTMASLRPERLFPGSGRVRRTPVPELLDKVNYLTKLAAEVALLEAKGMSVAEMTAVLFKQKPGITYWSMGHFSTAYLIEACRSYNAIFLPPAAPAYAPAPPKSAGRLTGSSDSSGSLSGGHGDPVR